MEHSQPLLYRSTSVCDYVIRLYYLTIIRTNQVKANYIARGIVASGGNSNPRKLLCFSSVATGHFIKLCAGTENVLRGGLNEYSMGRNY